jgi:Fe-S cluster biogenesis protein NfuA
MSNDLAISAQITPNPNTLKFMLNQTLIASGSIDFSTPEKAEKSPLVEALFTIEGVNSVMVGVNFVSVTKFPETDWAALAEPVTSTIRECFATGETLINPELVTTGHAQAFSDIENRIKEILDQEIRPAVAMDGGDIVFQNYEDGIVYLHLQGACSSCPSATLTLKMGIENRLKEEFPEILEVVQV